ncbi:MAG TPA: choice-of-anchor D domain-containing protein [Terriglobales bacterium]
MLPEKNIPRPHLSTYLCAGGISSQRLIGWLAISVVALATATAASAQIAPNNIGTVAGGGAISSSPLSANIPLPVAVTEDKSGNVYVASPAGQYIYQLSTGNTVAPFAGMGWAGYGQISGPNGIATQIPVNAPSGVGVGPTGQLYIADTVNNVIRYVHHSSGEYHINTVVGKRQSCILSEWPTCNDGKPALDANLNAPQGVVLDANSDIYIADTGDNVIRCVIGVSGACNSTDAVGDIVALAGNYKVCGSPTNACGDNGPATEAMLNGPMGVSLDADNNVYIADTGDNRIRCVAAVPNGCVSNGKVGYIYTVAGTGVAGYSGDGKSATLAELKGPRGVSATSAGTFYIADTKNSCVREVASGTIKDFAAKCTAPGFLGDGGPATAAKMMIPNGVYADGKGNVFVADTENQRIRKIASGTINTILGGGSGADGSASTAATLAYPYQVAVDSSGNYYIADTDDNRIRVVNTQQSAITVATVEIQPGQIETVAGDGLTGYSGNGGAALSATLNSPFGVAVDTSGNIYIADTYNGWVREVDGSTGVINNVAPTKVISEPTALAIDSHDNLFIADPVAEVIWEVSGGSINVVAGILNQSGSGGDGGPATAAKLNGPSGVAVNENDDIYIADSNNNVIRCVLGAAKGCGGSSQAVGNIINYCYTGGGGYNGDGGPCSSAARGEPKEVALDSHGNLFVGGGTYDTVQRIDSASGTITRVAGDKSQPRFGFSGDGGPATLSVLDNIGLAIDANENLYIADAGNNRIREVPMSAVVALSSTSLNFGNEPVGQTSASQQITLSNTGLDALSIASITITGSNPGDFSQNNNCPISPKTVPPGANGKSSCTITISFKPKATGTRKAKVSISDNGLHNPQTIQLTGDGT